MTDSKPTERAVEGRLEAAYRSAPVVPAPASLRDAVAAKWTGDRKGRVGRQFEPIPRPFAALVGIAAAVMLVVGTGVYFVTRPNESGNPGRGDAPVTATATTPDGFRLTVRVPHSRFRPGESIPVETTLVYEGPNGSIEVYGSGADGLVYFGVKQLDGNLEVAPAGRESCGAYSYQRGVATAVPFQKTGGYIQDQDTPQNRFAAQYFATKNLTLPAGRWQVFAELSYDLRTCGGQHREAIAPVTVTVSPEGVVVTPTAGPSEPNSPVSASTTTPQGITLSISAPRTRYARGEAVPVSARMRYDGPAESATVYGSSQGVAVIGLRNVATGAEYEPAVTADCGSHVLRHGVEVPVEFVKKSIDFSYPASSDSQFFADHASSPDLVLPAGRWRLFVRARYATGPCGSGAADGTGEASIEVVVSAASAPNPSQTSEPSAPPSVNPPTEVPSGEPVPPDRPSSSPSGPTAPAATTIHWQPATFPNGQLWVANGRVWSFGRTIQSSADGQHWERMATADTLVSGPALVIQWSAVAEDGRGGLVAFATEESAPGSTAGIARPIQLFSTDGRQWTRAEFEGVVNGTATVGRTVVATGSIPGANDTQQAAIWWSTDRSAWTNATIDGVDGLLYAYAPVAWQGRLFALGMTAANGAPTAVLLTSPDGKTWSRAGSPPGATPGMMLAAGDRLVALGNDPRGAALSASTSTDGSTWQAGTISPSAERQTLVAALVRVNGTLVALGSGIADAAAGPNPGAAWVSADGSSWTLTAGTPRWNQAVVPGVAFGNRILLADAISQPDDTRATVDGWIGTVSNP